jgi:predicted transcriptional regulator
MEYVTRDKPWQQQRESISKHNRARKRYNDARKALPGFPIPPKKFTYDEIVDYYKDETIQCLLCGRSLATLAKHLTFIHSTSIEEYKDRYGLPNKRGLTGTTASTAYREAVKKRLENPDDPSYKYFNDATIREEIRKKAVISSQHQKYQPFHGELAKKHLPK